MATEGASGEANIPEERGWRKIKTLTSRRELVEQGPSSFLIDFRLCTPDGTPICNLEDSVVDELKDSEDNTEEVRLPQEQIYMQYCFAYLL